VFHSEVKSKAASTFTWISDVFCQAVQKLLNCSTNRRDAILSYAYWLIFLVPFYDLFCQSLQCLDSTHSTYRPPIPYSHHFCIYSNSNFQSALEERHWKPQYSSIFLHLCFGWYLVPYGAKLMQSTITDIIWVRRSIIGNIWGGNRGHQQSPEGQQWQKKTTLAIQKSNANSFWI